jgi:hypothetical protein
MNVKITGKRVINKRKIIIISIIILVILGTLFFAYCIVWRVDVLANVQVDYLNDYRDYYFTTRLVIRRTIVGTTAARQIIYFKPGQKGKMLNKIKSDVTNYLEELVEEYGYIFYKYEISDDFKRVKIYETPGSIGSSVLFDLNPKLIRRIRSLTALYNSIEEGSTSSNSVEIIKYIEPKVLRS